MYTQTSGQYEVSRILIMHMHGVRHSEITEDGLPRDPVRGQAIAEDSVLNSRTTALALARAASPRARASNVR